METENPMTTEPRQEASVPGKNGSGERQKDPALSYEELCRHMVENVQDVALFSIGLAGQVESWNPGAARIFGYSELEILGQPVSILFTPEDNQAGIPERERSTAACAGRAHEELWHVRKDGRRFWSSDTVTPLRDEQGALRGFVEVCQDRSDWKQAEERYQESLAREHEARTQAEKIGRIKDEFLATVSHELRTPLNAIVGWADILAVPQGDPDTVAHAVQVIRRNAKVQKQLIEDLLDVSRIISGRLRLSVRPLDVGAVLKGALDAIRPAAEAKSIKLQELITPEAGAVMGDPDRLRQVFWNLLSNAVKFTPKGGQVTVFLHRGKASVELLVSDTGQGISPDFMTSLFQRFRQADGSPSRAHTGLGLGLAIARHLTELHGGTIHAESGGDGKGATFSVSLPLSQQQLAYETEKEPAPAPPPAPTPPPARAEEGAEKPLRLDGLRLLVVDDEKDTADFLSILLTQRGAKVSIARSAAEAFETLQRERPDVLISDIGMPHEDGYSLIRKIRALPTERGGQIPAVALTAYSRDQDRVRALVAGFQNHVVKPVQAAVLVAVVANLAGRRDHSIN
jgi:PAS domain S-box-containing protein